MASGLTYGQINGDESTQSSFKTNECNYILNQHKSTLSKSCPNLLSSFQSIVYTFLQIPFALLFQSKRATVTITLFC